MEKVTQDELDAIYDKKINCAVCEKEFTTKVVRVGKGRLLGQDFDLRPHYKGIDITKYDVIACPHCGYAALSKQFDTVMRRQVTLIKEQIVQNYRPNTNNQEHEFYTYDDAIAKHKMALLNAVVKKGKQSEGAYLCLKLAWLLRGKADYKKENSEGKNIEAELNQLAEQEKGFLRKAYEGFTKAFSEETLPLYGMDEPTMEYLLAALAKECGDKDESMRLASKVIVSRGAPEKLKDKARQLKEMYEA